MVIETKKDKNGNIIYEKHDDGYYENHIILTV